MKYVERAADFLLYSNLFIALCAGIFVLGYYSVDDSVPADYRYVFVVFLSTLSVYSFHRWYSFNPDKSRVFNIRNRSISRIRPFLFLWAVFTGAIAIGFFLAGREYSIGMAVPPVILSFLYLIPFYKNKRLRDFSYIKIYIVSAVWAWVAVIFPAAESAWEPWEKICLSGGQFFLVFGLILPMDYRDRLKDSSERMRSYAHIFSLPTLKKAGCSSFGISFILQMALIFHQTIHPYFTVGYLAAALLAVFLTVRYNGNEPDYFYTGLIDGVLLVQGGLLFLISFFVSS